MARRTKLAVLFAAFLCLLLAASCTSSPSVTFSGGGGTSKLAVEIVDTAQERAGGLSNRESLPTDSGMLFVWQADTNTPFWMKNTSIPLSIAFVGSDMRVIAVRDLKPFDETSVTSPEPYRYAVEANRGWFTENGIGAGARMTLNQ